MKNRINLYVEQLKPVKEPLPLSMSLAIVAACLTLMLMVFITLFAWQRNEITQQQHLRMTLAQEQSLLVQQATTLSRIANNQQILDEISKHKEKIKNKKRILTALNHHLEDTSGFTQLLLALAKVSDRNVWLTQIKSQSGALTLRGAATRSRDIPQWVKRLNLAPELKGKTFSALSMKREDKLINFVLKNVVDSSAASSNTLIEVAQ